MLSSSSGSRSLRGRPSCLLLSAAAAGAETGSPETPQSSAAVAVEPQASAEASAAPVAAQSAPVSAVSAAATVGPAAQSFAFDSTAASTVAACSVLNSALPSSPPQP